MDESDLSFQLLRYENRWVAILESEERIVASGSDAYEVQQAAEKQGYSDVLIMRVRETDGRYAFRIG